MTQPTTRNIQTRPCPACGARLPIGDSHSCSAASERAGSASASSGSTPSDSGNALALADLIGSTLGERYEILELISQGGMGAIFKARHVVLGSQLAVKVLLKPQDQEAQRRFMQEARLASQLHHPHIVYIFDFGVLSDGRSYLVMEYLKGPTLADALERGRLDPLRACEITAQIARGLEAVHAHGIVHRDLKPANIFLLQQTNRRDFVKIVDFGIAYAEGSVLGPEELARPVGRDFSLAPISGSQATQARQLQQRHTLPGTVLGTPHYMAPEQADSEPSDARSDQYALGCILYEMLTGRPPFGGNSVAQIIAKHRSVAPLSARKRCPEAQVSASLDELVLRTLAKERSDRFPSMAEVGDALDQEIETLRLERGLKTSVGGELADSVRKRSSSGLLLVEPPPSPPLQRWLRPALGLSLCGLLVAGGAIYRLQPGRPPSAQLVDRPPDAAQLQQAAIAALRGGLQSTELGQRLEATQALAHSDEPTFGRPLLEPLLRDTRPELQAAGARALSELTWREALPMLRSLSDSSSAAPVQLAVAIALDDLGEAEGVQRLQRLLSDSDPTVAEPAALALASRGDRQALRQLAAIAENPGSSPALQLAALGKLAEGGDGAAHRRLVARLAPTEPLEQRLRAATLLAAQGDSAAHLLLRELATHGGPAQLRAARWLASPEEPILIELFRQTLRRAASPLADQQLAVAGLGLSGQHSDLELFLPLLSGASPPSLRLESGRALLQLLGREPQALADRNLRWAQRASSDSDWLLRQAAATLLGDLPTADSLPLLNSLLHDSDPQVRKSAARALGRRHEREALLILRDGLQDGSPEVREQTLRSLGSLGVDLQQHKVAVVAQLAVYLQELRQRGTDGEQLLASTTLLRVGVDGERQHLRHLLTSPQPALRQLVVEESGLDRELLWAALSDPLPAIRFRAAGKLALLGLRGEPRLHSLLGEALSQRGVDGLYAYAALRKLGATATAPEAPAELWRRSWRSERMRLVELVTLLPSDEASQLLRQAASDPDSAVRHRTAELAAQLAGASHTPVATEVLRQLSHDREAPLRARASTLLSVLASPPPPPLGGK